MTLEEIRELETKLTDDQFAVYYNALYMIVVRDSPEGSKNILRGVVCATAGQREEALQESTKP